MKIRLYDLLQNTAPGGGVKASRNGRTLAFIWRLLYWGPSKSPIQTQHFCFDIWIQQSIVNRAFCSDPKNIFLTYIVPTYSYWDPLKSSVSNINFSFLYFDPKIAFIPSVLLEPQKGNFIFITKHDFQSQVKGNRKE